MSNTDHERDRLALGMGWSLARAQGFLDGEAFQKKGEMLSSEYKVGMDEYSKGFRTGYYTQACSLSIWELRDSLMGDKSRQKESA